MYTMINWTPEFLLKRYILSGIRDGPQEPLIADSIDFIVSQLEILQQHDLASRLTLNTAVGAIGKILVPDSAITIMDTNDYCAIPQRLRDEVGLRYAGARKAVLKSGGDFPFLSRADEVNLYLQLHLRQVNVHGIAALKDPEKDGDSAKDEDEIGSSGYSNPGLPPSVGGSGAGSSPSSTNSSSTHEVYGQQAMLNTETACKFTPYSCNIGELYKTKGEGNSGFLLVLYLLSFLSLPVLVPDIKLAGTLLQNSAHFQYPVTVVFF
ncbi:hypothetical protein KP509_32G025700 [Ceratopteris richardii]|uniref:Uncharacterized protein n=1 Tax=Ceratopteris richardii TaxID=49495 RepID=A0A8T2QSI6_CERRI|nr:hypothetical protein KP509_32G025700 [Ceratopteris richardii]